MLIAGLLLQRTREPNVEGPIWTAVFDNRDTAYYEGQWPWIDQFRHSDSQAMV
jgi:hypothetical protein